MIRVFVKTWNRRNLQVNGSEVQFIQSFDIESPELETYLRDDDAGWQNHHVIGVELLRSQLAAQAATTQDAE